MFPEAPIYTLIHKPGSTSPIIESREIITSDLNKIPNVHQSYRKFLPLMPLAAERMKITHEADLIISSSHCVIKGVTKPNHAKHVCYIHSPMRYIYDQFDNYFGHTSLPTKMAAHLIRPYLTFWDRRSNENVDYFVANSTFVANRVKQFYGREAEVIHPFVDLKDFENLQKAPPQKENFYLCVSAFAPNKRLDLAIEAFNLLGPAFKLKIVGSGSQEETQKLKALAHSHIEFLGNLEREEIIALFFKAKAFVFPGIEDFGITPLESIAAGTPVIALHEAGVLDTMTEKTAKFFYQQDVESLERAVRDFSLEAFKREDLLARAASFSKDQFKENISSLISRLI
jgi:glycosyltransferase involved in cell wall biosynthesis